MTCVQGQQLCQSELPDASDERCIAALLRGWHGSRAHPDGEVPEKLVYPLDHAYTPAELGFAALKGADAAAAGVLAVAAQDAHCDLHLALLTVEEHGVAEYADGYGSRRDRWGQDEDAFEAGEVYDRSVTLSEWRRPDGGGTVLGAIPVDEEGELSPPDACDDLTPDEEHFHEAPATRVPRSSAPTSGRRWCFGQASGCLRC